MSHVLVVDDEPSICWGFQQFLSDAGHRVSTTATAEEGLDVAEETPPDVIVLDVRLPGMDGLTAVRQFRRHVPEAPIIIITAHGNLDTAVQAVREGAFDYLPKPFDLDRASDIVQRALEHRRQGDQGTEKPPQQPAEWLIGRSPAMQEVFKQVALAAASEVPVFITGESGTGKEMVARAIHTHSLRAGKPFLPVSLVALSPGLIESELFGHVKGAFTGAERNRTGLLELAEGGTVLLDEIAEVEPALQVKLLRVLEQHEITPVGSAETRKIRVRLIAATNRSLPEEIAAGRFREDFYYRLSVFRIHLPPLRERREDIPLLAAHFLQQTGAENPPAELSGETLTELQRRQWPGNVRELRNVMEHAAIVARGGLIRPEHLPPPETLRSTSASPSAEFDLAGAISRWTQQQLATTDTTDSASALHETFLAACEPALLKAVLEHCGHHRARAAHLLGLHRTTLRQKLRRYGLDEMPE